MGNDTKHTEIPCPNTVAVISNYANNHYQKDSFFFQPTPINGNFQEPRNIVQCKWGHASERFIALTSFNSLCSAVVVLSNLFTSVTLVVVGDNLKQYAKYRPRT